LDINLTTEDVSEKAIAAAITIAGGRLSDEEIKGKHWNAVDARGEMRRANPPLSPPPPLAIDGRWSPNPRTGNERTPYISVPG
jgi:hypothetical protein